MSDSRLGVVKDLEAPIRTLFSGGPNWVALSDRDEAVQSIRSILAQLDKIDAKDHMLRRRNYVEGVVRAAIRTRVEATRTPLAAGRVVTCRGGYGCSRDAKWTVDRFEPSQERKPGTFSEYVTIPPGPRPYCTQHSTKAVEEEARRIVQLAYKRIGGKDYYAQPKDLDEALALAKALDVEIDPVAVEAVK